jgi:hypothetical protein
VQQVKPLMIPIAHGEGGILQPDVLKDLKITTKLYASHWVNGACRK